MSLITSCLRPLEYLLSDTEVWNGSSMIFMAENIFVCYRILGMDLCYLVLTVSSISEVVTLEALT